MLRIRSSETADAGRVLPGVNLESQGLVTIIEIPRAALTAF